jgi:hypothetical protein
MGSRLSRSFKQAVNTISLNIVSDIDVDWMLTGDKSPVEQIFDQMSFLEFSHEDSQEIISEVRVPSNYLTGKPIRLVNGSFFTNETMGTIMFKCHVSVIRPNITAQGSFEAEVESDNEFIVNGSQGTHTQIDEIPLTDAFGMIDGFQVRAKDILRIRFYRDPEAESVSSLGSAYLMKESFIVKAS